MTSPVRVVSIGECMIELRARDTDTVVGFGGDTANFAVYLAHYAAPSDVDISYLTLVGDDGYSQRMLEWLERHRVSTRFSETLPGERSGLYLVEVAERGERSFTYYRDGAAARQLFTAASPLADAALAQADWVYLSGVTAAIMRPDARQALLCGLDSVRERGGHVVFDSNFRPALWADYATARTVMTELLRRSDIALPTLVDDREVFGDEDEHATARRLHALGVAEVVVKLGELGAFVSHDGIADHIPAVNAHAAVDTTAAGDSFNAGYLFGRIRGDAPVSAARIGTHLAAAVVSQPGAVIDTRYLPVLPGIEVGT